MTNSTQEPKPKAVDGEIVVTHLNGTEERFPVKITRQAAPKPKEEER